MIFEQKINRPVPRLGPEYFRTYAILRPRATHFRKASCAEVNCPNRERGWKTVVDVSTTLGQGQANYVRLKSGLSFTVSQAGDIVTFVFYPGQNCFSEHMVPLDREPNFRKLDGDWRGYRSEPVVMRASDWLDDFGTHQERLVEQRRRA